MCVSYFLDKIPGIANQENHNMLHRFLHFLDMLLRSLIGIARGWKESDRSLYDIHPQVKTS